MKHPHHIDKTNACSEECRARRKRDLTHKRVRHSRCRICGKRMVGENRYCDECKAKGLGCADMSRAFDPVPLDVIRYAKTQPRGVSDARWRMELSRRKLERGCPDYYHQLPDPDWLGN